MNIFWSYARRDNMPPGEKVSRLRRAFAAVLSQVRGEDCAVHFDAASLNWGVEWRQEIEHLIRHSDGLVAIVTPSYFNSRMCIYELQMAIAASRKILPIYFRTCKELKSSFKEDGVEAELNQALNRASLKIGQVQMRDFRALRNEKTDSKAVEDFLDAIAEQLA